MAYPTAYNRSYSFTDYQTSNPSNPLPGNQVDSELNNVEQTLDLLLAFVALIQKSDGTLKNDSVGVDQLKAEVSFGLNSVSDWQSGTDYAANAGVWVNGVKLYRCIVPHTSTVFATDLAAGRWSLLVDFSGPVTAAATSETNAGNSATAAAASATSAAASYDNFDDRYLGTKSSDPTLDNDGNALLTGALYFNTSISRMRVYSGSAWADVTSNATATSFYYVATSSQTTFSGSDQNGNILVYTPGGIEVFVNGLRKLPSDYTATNGTSVVFGAGLTASDKVLITSFTAFTLTDQSVFYQATLGANYYN